MASLVLTYSTHDHFHSIFEQSYSCTSKHLKTWTSDTVLYYKRLYAITKEQAISLEVLEVKLLLQSNVSMERNGHIHFLLIQDFFSFAIKLNVGWNGDCALRDLYNLWQSDAFPQFQMSVSNQISEAHLADLSSLNHFPIMQSRHGTVSSSRGVQMVNGSLRFNDDWRLNLRC